MKIIETQCPNCGAKLKVKPDVTKIRCKNCKEMVNVEKGIEINTSKIQDVVVGIGKAIIAFLGFFFLPSLFVLILEKIGINKDLVVQVIAELIVVAIYVFAFKDTLIKDFKNFKKENLNFMAKWWFLGLIIMFTSNILINLLVFHGEIAANEEQTREIILSIPLLGLIFAGVLAPLLEELTFRRGFRTICENKVVFVIISAFVFALMHVLTGYVDTHSLKEFLYLIPYGSLGASFAIIYAYTDNIWSSIIMHAFHNTITVLLLILAQSLM